MRCEEFITRLALYAYKNGTAGREMPFFKGKICLFVVKEHRVYQWRLRSSLEGSRQTRSAIIFFRLAAEAATAATRGVDGVAPFWLRVKLRCRRDLRRRACTTHTHIKEGGMFCKLLSGPHFEEIRRSISLE